MSPTGTTNEVRIQLGQLWTHLKVAYAAFEAAYKATFVGKAIIALTPAVLIWLAEKLDFDPLRMVDTGNIIFDFQASFALSIAGTLAIALILFEIYVGAVSLVRALIFHLRPGGGTSDEER